MEQFKKSISSVLILTLFLSCIPAYPEAMDDKMTNIVPGRSLGGGEFVHGQGYGKVLMRVMMFGSIPQQGVHYMPEGTDLLFAMLFSGGYSETSKIDKISIRRKGQAELIKVNLEALMEKGGSIPKIQDGDIIDVPFNWKKDVTTISMITGFITAMTGFALSLVALTR